MSRTRIVGGSITKNSTGNTTIEVTEGKFTSAASSRNSWEGESTGISEHNYTAVAAKADEAEEEFLNGYFYNEDGSFVRKQNMPDNKGDAEDTYTCTGEEKKTKKNGTEAYSFTAPVLLKDDTTNIKHTDFCYIAYVIKFESGGSEIKELKCLAFASHNHATNTKTTWKKLLSTGYSSVPHKTQMSETLKDTKSKNTRVAIFSVLKAETDITKGAEYWDGTDFLAWGNSETNPYNKLGQNKFDEYKFVEIPKDVYDDFLKANGSSVRYPDKGNHVTAADSGTHTHITKQVPAKDKDGKPILKDGKPTFTEVPSKIKYDLPAGDFSDQTHWTSGSFYYDTGVKATNGISATITAGKSIFWKLTPTRLTPETAPPK